MRRRTIGLIVALAIVHVILLSAGFVAPYDPAAQNRDFPYAPPTPPHIKDSSGHYHRPFIYPMAVGPEGYVQDTAHPCPILFLVKGQPYKFLGLFQSDLHVFGVTEPATVDLFGTDAFGRDEFSRVLYGGQISIAAGMAATVMALALGTFVGVLAGYYGKLVDESLMGAAELFLSLPWLYFLFGVRAFLPLHLSPVRTFFLVTLVIGFIGWARPARLVRGIVLSTRSRNHVSAARGFGASDFYLLRRHILPEVRGVLLTQAVLLIPRYIAAEVALSFFGLGVSEPVASWGNMLGVLQQYNVVVSYYWMFAPLIALIITSVIYGFLADALHSQLKFHSS
jgi:peptide/nickel transport system permease protein